MKSIISNEKECFICRTTYGLHQHHIFFGYGNRQISDEQGCWVYLCARHHNMSNLGVHFDKELDIRLKQECQKEFEKNESREQFRRIFGKSYL
jgi:hypothetical protein